jgi:hypothetical protein
MKAKKRININQLTAIGIAAVLGVALGYYGQWNILPEALPKNLVVLFGWVILTTLIALLYANSGNSPMAKAVGFALVLFLFLIFASYRHKSGGLGDSSDYFLVATYNLSFGDPAGINLSYPISKFTNQLLFDIGFSQIWLVPWILGVFFLTILASGLVIPMKHSKITDLNIPLLALLFSASSAVLYFFRTYMEVYTYGALFMGAGLILAAHGFRQKDQKMIFVSAVLLGFVPLFHVLFGIFLLTIGVWGLLLVLKTFSSPRSSLPWLFGLLSPAGVFILYLVISRPMTNLGSLRSLREPGSINPAITGLETWQIGISLAFLSFPFVFTFLISYLVNTKFISGPAGSQSTITPWLIGLLGALAIQWCLYVSVYWFLNGLDQDRDHMVTMTIPLACLLTQILPSISGKARNAAAAIYCFSCAVTATIVTSFIEPTFDTGALLESFIPG